MEHMALLERVLALREDIMAAVVIADGRMVDKLSKGRAYKPPKEDLERALLQSQLIIGIASTNEGFAGRTRFVLISHERLNALLVPLHDKKVLIVPFTGLRDLECLGRKVVELVANNRRLS